MPALEAVPAAFLELAAAGRFDYWGTTEPLTPEQRAELVMTRATEVLWWHEVIEWDRTPEDVAAYTRDALLRPGLVPFAGNGVGGHFCWYPAWQEGPEPPVILVEHDTLKSEMFAADFAGCLVRCMLQHFALHTFDSSEPDRATLWAAHARILAPYLEDSLAAVLAAVGDDPTPERCGEAEAALGSSTGRRSLVGVMQPTKFAEEQMPVDVARRCYDRSVGFYEDLVVNEGLAEFTDQLEQVRAARELFRARAGAGGAPSR